jgi:hypothetical protein
MPPPRPNTTYSRSKIQALLGGELQTYLPQRNKVILAGCFAVDRKNPSAPYEVQAGNAPKVAAKADLLVSQSATVFPVFLRKSEAAVDYYFVGNFRCVGQSKARSVIVAAERRSGRHGELSCVLYLEPVGKVHKPPF